MGDPAERMKKFVTAQQQQTRCDGARAAWSRKIVELLPHVESVVEIFRGGVVGGQFHECAVSVLANPVRDLFPLVVAFGPRMEGNVDVLPLRREPLPAETGASVLFRCAADGHVHGYRYPFHDASKGLPAEEYIDLGDPAHVHASDLGHAVADFLEWASVGGGCSGRAVQFGAPETLKFAQPSVEKLKLRAA